MLGLLLFLPHLFILGVEDSVLTKFHTLALIVDKLDLLALTHQGLWFSPKRNVSVREGAATFNLTAWLGRGGSTVAKDWQVLLDNLCRGLRLHLHSVICPIQVVFVICVFGHTTRAVPNFGPELYFVIDYFLHCEDDASDANFLTASQLETILNVANF